MAEDTDGTSLPVEDGLSGASRLIDDAVENAVVDIADPVERERVRQSVAEALRDSLLAMAGAVGSPASAEEMSWSAAPAPAAGSREVPSFGTGAEVGAETMKQVQQLGFAEFTRSLVDNTFDAVVGAHMKEMEAYAELVANLAQTLAQFQAANVSAADVTAFLAQRFPDGQGGTTVSPSYVFTETPVNTTTGEPAIPAADKMNAVGGTLLAEIPGLAAADVAVPAASPPADVRFSQGQVETIREKVATELARRMQLQLRDMARDGMRGIEVTDGRILSRLTFGVTTTDTAERVQSTYHSNNLSASVQGGFRRRRFGISGGVSGGFVNVNTVNERTFSSVSMSAQIVGEVELRFRTRTYLPPAPAPA